MRKIITAVIAAMFLAGCVTMPAVEKTSMLQQGMSTMTVQEILGPPQQTEFAQGKLIWKYNMFSMHAGVEPYYLIFDNATKKLESWYMNEAEYNRNREYMLKASPPPVRQDVDISVKQK